MQRFHLQKIELCALIPEEGTNPAGACCEAAAEDGNKS